ncbi:hypothetical protein GPECTOR_2g994 [Gonium pectorale]|uniref:Alpha-2-macroglobulin domain-containing protein n=1 Tax=Gonium pectorale TaxID=33097 RepID=A0A150H2C2_GONPE|nr:hypothetical protein GPECTOR_2g994 [Gonium pectorale]|eukprot:KXZ56112.1 hypothetical protein GPECTOR_2g994 [Gonium pectorale]
MVNRQPVMRRRASALLLLCAVSAWQCSAAPAKAKSAFMSEVPLTIVMSTPAELASEGAAYVYGRQALTAVFSRPVIALGSDFNSRAAQQRAAFRLSCPMPGKLRWVTTTIARFDPNMDWPTDLECNLVWNTSLTSYDGLKLQLGSIPARRKLSSGNLYMSAGSITSDLAMNLTDNVWSAYQGAPDDKLPEMPPDGKLYLGFNNPVHLRTLAGALKLRASNDGTDSAEGPELPFKLSACYSDAPWVTTQAPAASLDVNATCAMVEPGAALQVDTCIKVASDPELKDGYGLSLTASAAIFTGAEIAYSFTAPSMIGGYGLAVLEPGDPLAAFPYITRSPPPLTYANLPEGYSRNMSLFVVDGTSESGLAKVMKIARNDVNYEDPWSFLGSPTASIKVPMELTTPGAGVGWTEVRLPLEDTSLQIVQACCDPYANAAYAAYASTKVLLRTDLAVSVFQSGPRLIAWVTDTSLRGGAGPVAGANVSFYFVPYKTWASPSGLQLPGTRYALVEVSPEWHPYDGKEDPMRFVMVFNGTAGTLHGEIPVPADARLQSYSLTLRLPPAGSAYELRPGGGLPAPPSATDYDAYSDWVYVAQESFLVAQPRPPTAELLVEAPSWSLKTGRVVVNVTAVSYIGASLEGQAVTLSWSAYPSGARLSLTTDASGAASATIDLGALPEQNRTYMSSSMGISVEWVEAPSWSLKTGRVVVNVTAVSYIGASLEGQAVTLSWSAYPSGARLSLTTDASGAASATIDLGALPEQNRTYMSSSMGISVEWVGPTRERITKYASVSLVDAPLLLSLTRSLATDIPGVTFAVSVDAKAADGEAHPGLPVTVTLRPNPNATAPSQPSCAAPITCTVASGAGLAGSASSPPCRLAIPCVGDYELRACADVPAALRVPGGPTSACIPGPLLLGRNATEWARDPLNGYDLPSIFLDKPDGYQMGDQPKLYLENPYANARLLVAWGNDFVFRHVLLPSVAAGSLAEVSIGPLGAECVGGCSLTALLDVPRAGPGDAPVLPPRDQLAVSAVFDPAAPHSHRLDASLAIESAPPLEVAVGVAAAGGGGVSVQDASREELVTIEPGATAQISVTVDSPPADSPLEVTVYAVDQAFLDLLPYELTDVQQAMVLQLYSSIEARDMQAYRVAPGAIRAVIDKLMYRLTQLDPWLPVDTDVGQGANPIFKTRPVDVADEDYLARYTSPITALPGYFSPDYYSNRPLAPSSRRSKPGDQNTGSEEDLGTDASGNDDDGSVRSASSFRVTPLFAVASPGKDGVTRVNFTAPQNLGSFVIRAYAASGRAARYGAGEAKLVVRRRLSLTASVPRFVRVGDSFEAGVLVTVGSAPATVTLTMKLVDPSSSPLSAVGSKSRMVSFKAGEGLQKEVRFSFKGVAVGRANLTFTAADSQAGGGRDGLSMELAVEPPQGDVWVATSFALAANGSAAAWQEGVELPDAVPGSGNLTLTAGVGNFPFLTTLYGGLLAAEEYSDEPYAPTAVLWSLLPPLLLNYGQATSVAQDQAITGAFADLQALTDAEYGLLWSDPRRWQNWYPQRTDTYLNIWALFLVGSQSAAMRPSPAAPLPTGLAPHRAEWNELETRRVPAWRRALGEQLLRDAVDWHVNAKMSYSDWHTLAWARCY